MYKKAPSSYLVQGKSIHERSSYFAKGQPKSKKHKMGQITNEEELISEINDTLKELINFVCQESSKIGQPF